MTVWAILGGLVVVLVVLAAVISTRQRRRQAALGTSIVELAAAKEAARDRRAERYDSGTQANGQ